MADLTPPENFCSTEIILGCPIITVQLYPYQQDAVERHLKILDQLGASLDGTRCGGGKTVIASEIARRFALPVGVICPKSVLKKWEQTLNEFNVTPLFVLNPEKLRNGSTPWAVRGTFRNKPTLKWALPATSLLIFDEVHNYGGHDSLNSKLLLAAANQARVLMLSATAAENPMRLKAIGTALRLFLPGGHWNWMLRMGVEQNAMGGLEWNPFSHQNKARMERLHDSLFTSRGYKVPDEIISAQIPPLTVSDEPLELSDSDMRKIRELYAEMTESSDIGAVANLRQRQAIELIKVPYLLERAEGIISDGGQVVTFLNFHASIDAYHAAANTHIGAVQKLDGREDPKSRLAAQAGFQQGSCRHLVVQIQAGGQSIDLHDTHGDRPRTALICPQFSGTVEEQAIGRISRVGAKSPALALRVYAKGSKEEDAIHIAKHKRENLNILHGTVMTPKPTEHEERAHAEHSPSSLKEKAKCPGFRNDNTRDTSAADRGTLGHLAVEKANLDVIPADDPYLRTAAEKCLKYLAVLRSRCVGNREEIRERRYDLHDQFGHIDHLILHDNETKAELVDYKFAWNPYEADSPQFWGYAYAILKAYPKVEQITVHVLLPFLDEIDVHTWTRRDYDELAAKSLAVIEAAKRNDPEFYQTGEHCTWCANKASCKKLGTVFLTLTSNYKPNEIQFPEGAFDPENVNSPELMALFKKAAPVAKAWAAAVEERAFNMRVQEGIEIPGWELAERKAPFKITDAQAAWEVVKNQITPDAFAACCDVAIGELEKAVGRVAPKGKIGESKAQLRDALIDASAAKVDGTVLYLKKSRLTLNDSTPALSNITTAE